MGHEHNHEQDTNTQLIFAVGVNVLLTIAQIVGGILSGSLSLIADALHNLSDAGAILVALIARNIGNRSATSSMTYGFKRAEIVGVLINSTMLILVGIYLIFEAIDKYFNPTPIDGWIVFWVAGIALFIDIVTALLTYSAGAKDNMNIKAAFIHNVSDALASVAVIIAAILIINYELYIFDVLATVGISAYVIFHGIQLLKKSTLIIMQAVPDNVDLSELKLTVNTIEGVADIEHVHVWQLDDKKIFLEGHLVLDEGNAEQIKQRVRNVLENQFSINHTTLETSYDIKRVMLDDPI
ncbi:putative cation efflux protein [Marinomonas sp. MED121]|uniref:cation diffusion facilitator family transporter n=1 Tax=Marinomonas sp. MED121 TaxID=314277 RepID=UPI000068FF84|nr:cation diffusion facilitator family transporter [Marinomonas sp. MED121]EAQ66804.1 putative cation efflux protein [Marinomonas sp. MED121]